MQILKIRVQSSKIIKIIHLSTQETYFNET